MAAILRFNQLEVWKKAHQAVLAVYKQTREFPSFERFVLGAQMRRAAISIPANIAEGSARRRAGDKAHYYTIARSSAEELRYYYFLGLDLGYFREETWQAHEAALDEVCRMLYGMIESMEARKGG
jgi:four helix bundle protein